MFCTTVPGAETLGTICPLWPERHPECGGIRDAAGGYTSKTLAEYPAPLADDRAVLQAPHLAEVEEEEAEGQLKPTPLEEVLALGKERVALMKQAELASWVCDGGGNHSSGDWSSVPEASRHLQDPLGQVRRELRKIIRDNDLDKALAANMAVKAREAPWSADTAEKAQQVLLAHVRPQACSATERTQLLKVEEEQPLRLHLLEAIAASANDVDVAI